MQKPVSVIIADDHLLFIEGLKSLLCTEEGITILDVANDGRELLALLAHKHPDVVLLDINMPLLNGLDALRYIKQAHPALKIIMLSTYHEDHLIEKAKQSGAHGYLLKNCNRDELIQTLYLVNEGNTCFPYRLPKATFSVNEPDHFLKRFDLTKRETEVARLIKEGHTNQQIASHLFLSLYTVETHRKNIMHKLGLNKPGALLKFLLENDL